MDQRMMERQGSYHNLNDLIPVQYIHILSDKRRKKSYKSEVEVEFYQGKYIFIIYGGTLQNRSNISR